MNKFIFFSLFSILNSLYAQEVQCNIKIIEIDSSNINYYFKGIIIDKSKSKILIISKKDSTKLSFTKIKKGKSYLLNLSNYFSDEYIKKLPAKPVKTFLIREDNYIIWNGKTNLPYKSSDIKSNYYIRN